MYYRLIILIVILFFEGCIYSKKLNNSSTQLQIKKIDKFEKFNILMFNFNYQLFDPYIVKPIAIVWCNYIPIQLRLGFINIVNNLSEPNTTINYFFEGNVKIAMIHFTRFFLNTTFGLGGFIDVAEKANPILGIEKLPLTFGNVLGYYGFDYGPYIHLPIYGNFLIRDEYGNLIDNIYISKYFSLKWMLFGKWVIEKIEERVKLLKYDSILKQQSDPYNFYKNLYFQQHDFIENKRKINFNKNIKIKEIQENLNEIDIE